MTGDVDGSDANGSDASDVPGDPIEPSLADLLDDLVGEFPDVERRHGQAGLEFVAGAQSFARLTEGVAAFRLRPEIVAAATRTGDAAASTLGPEWVTFSPRRLDQYAIDRAQSWFELAHRLAVEAGRSPTRH